MYHEYTTRCSCIYYLFTFFKYIDCRQLLLQWNLDFIIPTIILFHCFSLTSELSYLNHCSYNWRHSIDRQWYPPVISKREAISHPHNYRIQLSGILNIGYLATVFMISASGLKIRISYSSINGTVAQYRQMTSAEFDIQRILFACLLDYVYQTVRWWHKTNIHRIQLSRILKIGFPVNIFMLSASALKIRIIPHIRSNISETFTLCRQLTAGNFDIERILFKCLWGDVCQTIWWWDQPKDFSQLR